MTATNVVSGGGDRVNITGSDDLKVTTKELEKITSIGRVAGSAHRENLADARHEYVQEEVQ